MPCWITINLYYIFVRGSAAIMNLSKKILSFCTAAALAAGCFTGTLSAGAAEPFNGTSPDNGDGTFRNPMLLTDVADPDCAMGKDENGNDAYYLVSTAMSYSPGAPIMRSYDLVNWETVAYVYDSLDYNSDALSLRNGQNGYGKGQWATSIRYVNNKYYVLFSSYTTGKTYVYTTDSIETGTWKKSVIEGVYHDPSLYFDTDGSMYAIFGGGQGALKCRKLVEDGDGFVSADEAFGEKTLINDMGAYLKKLGYTPDSSSGHFIIDGEGTHAYCVDGKLYLIFISWIGGNQPADKKSGEWMRIEGCYQAPTLADALARQDDAFTGNIILMEKMGYKGGNGTAQGGMMNTTGAQSTSEGVWKGIICQDRGPIGRCPCLTNVEWQMDENGLKWPMMNSAQEMEKTIPGYEPTSVVVSDEFVNGAKPNVRPAVTKSSGAVSLTDETVSAPAGGDGEIKPAAEDVELINNGDFEKDVTAPWDEFHAKLERVADGDNHILKVSDRVRNKEDDKGEQGTGNGAHYTIGKSLEPGKTYSFSAKLKYTDGPDTREFQMVFWNNWQKYTTGKTQWGDKYGGYPLGGTVLKKGEWGEISGEVTIPSYVDNMQSELAIGFITSWVQTPSAENDLMDYYLDDVSFRGVPNKDYEMPKDGEGDYNGSNLNMAWQWNHNPDNTCWSLTDRPGWLRLTTGKVVDNIQLARNTLTQRSYGPTSAGYVKMDVSGMKNGDYAGMTTMQTKYGNIGVKMTDGKKYYVLQYISGDAYNGAITDENWLTLKPDEKILGEVTGNYAYVGIEYFFGNFDNVQSDATAYFHYSDDGINWKYAGTLEKLNYDLRQFTGYKFGLFNYASEETGGYADFDYF